MLATEIHILRVSAFGLQPLLVEWATRSRGGAVYSAAIVWPSTPSTGDLGYEIVARLAVRSMTALAESSRGPDEIDAVARAAARETALIRAAELASAAPHPPAAIELTNFDPITLRAWRSLGYYEGLPQLSRQSVEVMNAIDTLSDVELERR